MASTRERYGPRVKTLATFEYLGETFRVCRPRFNGKVWASVGWLVVVHGDHKVYTASAPYQTMTPEMAINEFQRRAKGFAIHHGAKARDAMLGEIAKMKSNCED